MRDSSDVVLPGCKITWKASVPVLLPCEQQVARIMAQTRTDRTVVPVDSWVLLCPLRFGQVKELRPRSAGTRRDQALDPSVREVCRLLPLPRQPSAVDGSMLCAEVTST